MIRDDVKELVARKNYATISTLLPSGRIQAHVVWVDCDDDHILINTEVELRSSRTSRQIRGPPSPSGTRGILMSSRKFEVAWFRP